MTKATDKYLERAKEIVLAHLEGREATVFLFGSHATGTARRASDIDIGIEAQAPLPPSVLAELQEKLDESTVPYRVDIVDLSTVGADFRARAKQEGVRWSG